MYSANQDLYYQMSIKKEDFLSLFFFQCKIGKNERNAVTEKNITCMHLCRWTQYELWAHHLFYKKALFTVSFFKNFILIYYLLFLNKILRLCYEISNTPISGVIYLIELKSFLLFHETTINTSKYDSFFKTFLTDNLKYEIW